MLLKTDRHKKKNRSGVAPHRIAVLLFVGTILCASLVLCGQTQSARDRDHQPERVMDAVGLQPGMVVGEVEDPLFPDGALDMVFIVNAFHDLAKPVELLNNLLPSLKPRATVVIIDRDPEKFRDSAGHFQTKEEVLVRVSASPCVLDRLETFLPHHHIYVLRPRAPDADMAS